MQIVGEWLIILFKVKRASCKYISMLYKSIRSFLLPLSYYCVSRALGWTKKAFDLFGPDLQDKWSDEFNLRWIVTAWHCVEHMYFEGLYPASEVSVLLGAHRMLGRCSWKRTSSTKWVMKNLSTKTDYIYFTDNIQLRELLYLQII